MSFEFGGKIMQ